jgi:hypothetical protein
MNESKKRIPTSRFPPVPLARPLKVFGSTFKVEVSSGITIGPDTVLRAAIGKSLQFLLRKNAGPLVFNQFIYGLTGKHRLTRTTKANICKTFGAPLELLGISLDGTPPANELADSSDWECIAKAWGPKSEEDLFGVLIARMVALDQAYDAAARLAATGDRSSADRVLMMVLGDSVPIWRRLCPEVHARSCILIESSLKVLAALEQVGRAPHQSSEPKPSVVLDLLSPSKKPIGNWLQQLMATCRCGSLGDLADVLAKKAVVHHRHLVSRDTLKGWSSMRPGMLLTLEGCNALLKVLPNSAEVPMRQTRFALARFLAFLCDFLMSSVHSSPPSWPTTQDMLICRYISIREAGTST